MAETSARGRSNSDKRSKHLPCGENVSRRDRRKGLGVGDAANLAPLPQQVSVLPCGGLLPRNRVPDAHIIFGAGPITPSLAPSGEDFGSDSRGGGNAASGQLGVCHSSGHGALSVALGDRVPEPAPRSCAQEPPAGKGSAFSCPIAQPAAQGPASPPSSTRRAQGRASDSRTPQAHSEPGEEASCLLGETPKQRQPPPRCARSCPGLGTRRRAGGQGDRSAFLDSGAP